MYNKGLKKTVILRSDNRGPQYTCPWHSNGSQGNAVYYACHRGQAIQSGHCRSSVSIVRRLTSKDTLR